MKIEIYNEKFTVRDLIEGYQNLYEGGVYALGGKLEVRPPYQREFVYNEKQSADVIDSVIHGFPISLIYFCKKDDGTYECLDGQQRIISICEFSKSKYMIQDQNGHFSNYGKLLEEKSDLIDKFLNYKLLVAVCDGTTDEKLNWFERINKVGEPLTQQELKNAIYSSPWTTAAKSLFSHKDGFAYGITEKTYGRLIRKETDKAYRINRQEWLEQVIKWKCMFDGYDCSDERTTDEAISQYMLNHKEDTNDAADLKEYFQNLKGWVEKNFYYESTMMKCDWGCLYNAYHDVELDKEKTKELIDKLLLLAKKDKIGNAEGIYEFVFDGKAKHLEDRAFADEVKLPIWDAQSHKCAICGEEIPYEESYGDHIVPWSEGGQTIPSNCQILCLDCNLRKSKDKDRKAKLLYDSVRLHLGTD